MCGIAGLVSVGAPIDRARFAGALRTLSHRGPDDSGMHFTSRVALGHRRLSIIDLSPLGHQPMTGGDGASTIVFNGELYNYVELKRVLTGEGCEFRGNSDTEVLLAALDRWGPGAIARFNGMWGFAVWNERTGRLLVSRDRFGKKPFYYVHGPRGFAFASEPKALLALLPECRRVNEHALRRFLAEGIMSDDEQSFYEGVRLLPAASTGVYDAHTGRFEVERYWTYPSPEPARTMSDDEFLERFDATLLDAVKIRLRSDVPVGIALSGGLDSTAVLAAACEVGEARPRCITSTYGEAGKGELDWAIAAARPFGIVPVVADAPGRQAVEIFRRVAVHMDSPTYSPAVYPLWCLMQAVRANGIKVMLEGQGADELLGGYVQHAAAHLAHRLRRLDAWPALVGDARRLAGTFGAQSTALWTLRSLLPWSVSTYRKRRGAASVLRRPYEFGQGSGDASGAHAAVGDPFVTALYRDHAHAVLPALLHYGDAISMAHGVESRQPFMDYRLVELVMPIAADLKLRGGESKWPIRAFLRRHHSAHIADRTDKKGYLTPIDQWMSADQGRLLVDTLLGRNSMILEWADRARVRRLIDLFLGGATGVSNHLFRLLSAELWLEECIGQPNSEWRAAA